MTCDGWRFWCGSGLGLKVVSMLFKFMTDGMTGRVGSVGIKRFRCLSKGDDEENEKA